MNNTQSKLSRLFLVIALLMTALAFSGTASAQVCTATATITGSGSSAGNWVPVVTGLYLEAGTTITFSASHDQMIGTFIGLQYTGADTNWTGMDATGITWTVTLTVSGNYNFDVLAHGNFIFTLSYPTTTACDTPIPSDGRLCRWDHYVVYTDDDSIDVYGIHASRGYFVLSVSQEELDAVPGEAGVNSLIESSADGEVQVYRLETSDAIQVHAGMDFVRFKGLPAASVVCGTVRP